jgi:NAD(P)-dependent dehydrogenase (short-subunit alcohol dehydrogenase family)
MELGLAGKTVIVTGGSGGIGRGLVVGFAEEGAHVVIATRDAVQGQKVVDACKDLRGEAVVVPTDVTRTESVAAMVAETRRRFGAVDVLVNNAGGVAYPRPSVEKPRDEMQWELDLNIWGVVNCTRAVCEEMLARRSGSIINITSNSALLGEAAQMVTHYAGTKGYVMSWSKALAFEWGQQGVRINCVAPGWIVPWEQEHAGAGSFWQKYGYTFFGTPEQMAGQVESGTLPSVQNQPIRRLGRPEDMAGIVLFLASERASFITGQLISVSGGAYMP